MPRPFSVAEFEAILGRMPQAGLSLLTTLCLRKTSLDTTKGKPA